MLITFLYSELNPWIDLIIISDVEQGKEQDIQKTICDGFDSWWCLEDAASEPIIDWMFKYLNKHGYKDTFEIYCRIGEEAYE